jgi:hypothetical protein
LQLARKVSHLTGSVSATSPYVIGYIKTTGDTA